MMFFFGENAFPCIQDCSALASISGCAQCLNICAHGGRLQRCVIWNSWGSRGWRSVRMSSRDTLDKLTPLGFMSNFHFSAQGIRCKSTSQIDNVKVHLPNSACESQRTQLSQSSVVGAVFGHFLSEWPRPQRKGVRCTRASSSASQEGTFAVLSDSDSRAAFLSSANSRGAIDERGPTKGSRNK